MYPELVRDVRIRVIELQDHVLSTYDRAISDYTASEFSRRAPRRARSAACARQPHLGIRPRLNRLGVAPPAMGRRRAVMARP